MATGKLPRSTFDSELNKLLLIGLPVITFALLILSVKATHRSQAQEMRQWLTTLTARDVAQVVIMAEDTAARPLATVITAPATIQQLLTAYQQASSYGPGGGRLSGWQGRANFHLRAGRVIYSTVYQNEYAGLLFLSADSTARLGSPDDCLMSQAAGHLAQELSYPLR